MRLTGFRQFLSWQEGLLRPDRPIAAGLYRNALPITNDRFKRLLGRPAAGGPRRPPPLRRARLSPVVPSVRLVGRSRVVKSARTG